MFLPEEITAPVTEILSRKGLISTKLTGIQRVAGGDINQSYGLQYGDAGFFLKLNDAYRYPDMLASEAKGLMLIRSAEAIRIPEVLYVDTLGASQVLLLEWIERGPVTKKSSELLGRQLAGMHRCTHTHFGLDFDNYMGSLKQANTPALNWSDFFIHQRLEPQVKLALDKHLLDAAMYRKFEELYKRLDNLYPKEPPALVHGDLWSGNYLVNRAGVPFLIDPAVAYGYRETDIAMTLLFGGFDTAFYRAYQETFPLEKGWQERSQLWNLYPLLVHVNLFGRGYLSQLSACLNTWL
ncbi:fructosamine kinase family protein [Pedobacter sp. BS3]|uniref:fructosamine kinase family protein n=1 Tax=Pedobacter sp. BS3 TaxID=2567937 RepID=UPI0011EDE7C7|nr:fructosamine kinase family protein [Pedobacter sp. BS3]TZF84618.1 fructosamine kinase family protein [Pedobacter sp. BS3]